MFCAHVHCPLSAKTLTSVFQKKRPSTKFATKSVKPSRSASLENLRGNAVAMQKQDTLLQYIRGITRKKRKKEYDCVD